MAAYALARPHVRVASKAGRRNCGCASFLSKPARRSVSPSTSPLVSGPGSGRRHFPEQVASPADPGSDHFDKRSAAEVERMFPGAVRATNPLRMDEHEPQQPTAVELMHMDLGPTSGRRVRPPVASQDYQPHWLDQPLQ